MSAPRFGPLVGVARAETHEIVVGAFPNLQDFVMLHAEFAREETRLHAERGAA